MAQLKTAPSCLNAVTIPCAHNVVGNNLRTSYGEHLKVLQSIAGGTGSLDEDQGLEQRALEKPIAFLNHISVMKEGIQAMNKHHADMQEAWASMSHQCTTVKKNCGMPIKKGVM